MKIIATLFTATLILTGCMSTPIVNLTDTEQKSTAGSDSEGQATVYIFRGVSRMAIIWPLRVSVDGKHIGSLRRENYLSFPATSGQHKISIGCPAVCSIKLQIDTSFAANKTYYFALTPPLLTESPSFWNNSPLYLWSAVQLDEPSATPLIETYSPGKKAE